MRSNEADQDRYTHCTNQHRDEDRPQEYGPRIIGDFVVQNIVILVRTDEEKNYIVQQYYYRLGTDTAEPKQHIL